MNSKRLRPIAAGVTVAIGTMTFHSAVAQRTGQPTRPGEPCKTPPLDNDKWTPQEQWVWCKVCVGEIADFNTEKGYGGDLDPNEPEGWPESRVLTTRFLETILLHEPFRSAQTRRGVLIVGAWFKGSIDLTGAEIERELWLDRSRLDNGGSLTNARAGLLSLDGSVVGGPLSMGRAEIGSLYMRKGANFQEVDLRGAKISGRLAMTGSTFAGTLDMGSATVGGALFMYGGAKFQEVILNEAKIGDQLSMIGSTFAGTLNMASVTVDGSLFMREGANFQEVILNGAKIGDQLSMKGSTFAGTLNMASVTVGSHLFMRGAEFQAVNLIAAKIGGQLSMTGSTFLGTLDMNDATVERDLFMHGGAKFQEVMLRGAKIGGQLSMTGSTFDRTLNMNGTTVEGALIMAGVEFQDVNLSAAKIAGPLEMYDSAFAGTLDMRRATVGGNLYLDGADLTKAPLEGEWLSVGGNLDLYTAEVSEINLHGAKIGGQLSMNGSTFAGKLDMRSATVGGDLLLIEADLVEAPLFGRWLSVGGNLDLSRAKVNTINLRGATVVGELWLFESVREPGSILDLRDAKVGRLVARVGQSSPGSTRLAGFIYDALGSTESQTPESNPAEEAADSVERWLREEAVHSPQAHEQFALVLRKMGFPDRASRTLYEGKNHELREALRRGHLLQAGWLFVLWAMIGYGYRVWHALVWIAALVAVGWLVARMSGRKVPVTGEPLGFWYSADRLLPIVVLRKRHYEIDLPPRSRVYFYFHMVMGYVLTMFLLAGLSGLVG